MPFNLNFLLHIYGTNMPNSVTFDYECSVKAIDYTHVNVKLSIRPDIRCERSNYPGFLFPDVRTFKLTPNDIPNRKFLGTLAPSIFPRGLHSVAKAIFIHMGSRTVLFYTFQ